MSAKELATLRSSVTLHVADALSLVRVEGDEAFELVDEAFSRELYLQDGQMLPGLILQEDGRIFADLHVARDEEAFVLLADGPDTASLVSRLDRGDHRASLTVENAPVISLDGPYAWELLADFIGPEVIGLPYLTFFHDDAWSCYRTGKTGEYGYLLVLRDPEALARLRELGRRYDLMEIGRDTLDLAAFESWFYCPRNSGTHALTPLELQLQWMCSRLKRFTGSDALAERRARGWSRVVMARSRELPAGPVHHASEPIGTVVHARESPTCETWLSLLLLESAWAHPGLDLHAGSVALRTLTPPPIRNRSLFLNPQRHSYHTREHDTFPPILPETWADFTNE